MMAPTTTGQLTDQHLQVLVGSSGLSSEIIEGRGYRSLDVTEVLRLAQNAKYAGNIIKGEGWLSIPIYRPDGEHYGDIIRLNKPPDGWSMKYVWPTGAPQMLDVHPFCRDDLRDPDVPLIITEGIKKGDSILSAAYREGVKVVTVSLNGAAGWRGKVRPGHEATASITDWHDIPLRGRRVVLVADSDYRTNPNVEHEWRELYYYLGNKAGETKVSIVIVPSKGLEKQGADDYLIEHSFESLLEQATHLSQIEVVAPIQSLRYKTLREAYDAAALEIPAIIAGLIMERSANVMAGHSATFKTWHALRLCTDIALGSNYLGHPDLGVRLSGKCVYVNREMDEISFGSRIKRMLDHSDYPHARELLDREENPLILLDDAALDLADPHAVALFKAFLLDHKPVLCVLDSLSMCWSGDENSASDVGRLYKVVRTLIQETGCSFLILHHLTKPSKERPGFSMFHVRGSGQIIQQADTTLLLSHYQGAEEGEQMVLFKHEKSRHAAELPQWVTRFTEDEFKLIHLGFEGKLTDLKASAYTEARGTGKKLARIDLVRAMLADQRQMAMKQGIHLDFAVSAFNAALPPGEKPISASTMRRDLDTIAEEGHLIKALGHGKASDVWKMPEFDPNEEDDD